MDDWLLARVHFLVQKNKKIQNWKKIFSCKRNANGFNSGFGKGFNHEIFPSSYVGRFGKMLEAEIHPKNINIIPRNSKLKLKLQIAQLIVL